MCGFNLRFLPAVRLARELLDAGELGDLTHFRARFLASSALRADQRLTWRFDAARAGSGAVADLGSHIIDLARYLVGEPAAVCATTMTHVATRDGKPVDVDDAFAATVEFASGAIGTLEASRVAGRRSNVCAFEVDGTADRSRSTSSGSMSSSWSRSGRRRCGSMSRTRATRSWSCGGRRPAIRSAGATASCTSCATSSPAWPRAAPCDPTVRTSRTDTAARSCAARSWTRLAGDAPRGAPGVNDRHRPGDRRRDTGGGRESAPELAGDNPG